MDEGRQGMKESFGQMPEEVLTCLTSSLGADMVEKIKSGNSYAWFENWRCDERMF